MFKHTNLIMANKKSKACEDTCKVHDVLVGVCRHVLSGSIFHPGPIRIQFPQADGEQLHDFAGKILIRVIVAFIKSTVSLESQIVAHDGIVSNFP